MKWPESWRNVHLGTALRRGESSLDAIRRHLPWRHRAADADGSAAGVAGAPPAGPTAVPAPLSAILSAAGRRLHRLPEAARTQLRTLQGDGTTQLSIVLDSLIASGVSIQAMTEFAALWPKLDETVRSQVSRPLGGPDGGPLLFGPGHAALIDGSTCGSAVLVMQAAVGDPTLALWLAIGETLAGYLPREIRHIRPGSLMEPDAVARFGLAQREVKQQTNSGAVAGLPWPSGLGTPPWGAAREARFADLLFDNLPVDDSNTADFEAVRLRAEESVRAGVPVMLYVGGDLGRGVATAVPRHVVLLTDRHADGFTVYEPASGQVHTITDVQLRSRESSLALGGWNRVTWAILPRWRADDAGETMGSSPRLEGAP
jgi:hypothetical protein